MYGLSGRLSKMYHPYEVEGLPWSFKISGRSGMMLSGIVYPLPPLVRSTAGTESGSLPTPQRADGKACTTGTQNQILLAHVAAMWPTPAARDYKGANSLKHVMEGLANGSRGHLDQLPNAVVARGEPSGRLNPRWVEWLMGYPDGWTELNS